MFKFIVAVAFIAVASAQYGHQQQQHHEVDYHSHPKYEFKYGVEDKHTGDIKSAHEVRDGDITKGSYSLVEPDGTLRKVEYTVDKHSGFNAVVSRSGHASHPSGHQAAPVAYHHAPAVAYHSAPAVAYHSAPAVTVHHAPVLALQHSVPVHQVSAPSHGHATSYSSVVSHHAPVQHQGHY